MKPSKEFIKRIEKEFVDKGLIIEAGFAGYKLAAIPSDAPQYQLDDLRSCFFAGAQHLFSSILSILEPDAEPTENDLRRMDLIDKELKRFLEEFKRKHNLK